MLLSSEQLEPFVREVEVRAEAQPAGLGTGDATSDVRFGIRSEPLAPAAIGRGMRCTDHLYWPGRRIEPRLFVGLSSSSTVEAAEILVEGSAEVLADDATLPGILTTRTFSAWTSSTTSSGGSCVRFNRVLFNAVGVTAAPEEETDDTETDPRPWFATDARRPPPLSELQFGATDLRRLPPANDALGLIFMSEVPSMPIDPRIEPLPLPPPPPPPPLATPMILFARLDRSAFANIVCWCGPPWMKLFMLPRSASLFLIALLIPGMARKASPTYHVRRKCLRRI